LIGARIVVEGEVQRVGYRDFVQKVARKLGVKGYVENLKDGNVQIVCEAEESVLEGFVGKINVKEDIVGVERIRIVERFKTAIGFDCFEVKYGRLEEEFDETFGTLANYAKAMHRDLRNMLKGLKEDAAEVGEFASQRVGEEIQ